MIDTNQIKKRFPLDEAGKHKEELEKKLSEGYSNDTDMSALSADLSYATTIFEQYSEINNLIDQYEQALLMSKDTDPEIKEMAEIELNELEVKINKLSDQIEDIETEHELSDPDDRKSAILEIRAGAGGEEASLFGADLYRMYVNYANSKGWEIEMIDSSISESGGYKEVIAYVNGKGVYEKLKYESGVHRVQRIPTTESSGRIHTSTVSVAILPEAKDIEIDIKPEDLRIDTMRSSGAGGQSVNKTSSAVRITHLPSGIVVSCQDTKVQQQNKEKALQILRARLYELKKQEEMKERSKLRSSQIGTAMRAEKIRTYNYPQSRITDHRIKHSWHNLESVLDGNLEELLQTIHDEMRKLLLVEVKAQNSK